MQDIPYDKPPLSESDDPIDRGISILPTVAEIGSFVRVRMQAVERLLKVVNEYTAQLAKDPTDHMDLKPVLRRLSEAFDIECRIDDFLRNSERASIEYLQCVCQEWEEKDRGK